MRVAWAVPIVFAVALPGLAALQRQAVESIRSRSAQAQSLEDVIVETWGEEPVRFERAIVEMAGRRTAEAADHLENVAVATGNIAPISALGGMGILRSEEILLRWTDNRSNPAFRRAAVDALMNHAGSATFGKLWIRYRDGHRTLLSRLEHFCILARRCRTLGYAGWQERVDAEIPGLESLYAETGRAQILAAMAEVDSEAAVAALTRAHLNADDPAVRNLCSLLLSRSENPSAEWRAQDVLHAASITDRSVLKLLH